jgi:hypothetical protein
VNVFIDSNIPMYFAGREHPNRAPSERFLAAVERKEVEACTSAEVLQEILWGGSLDPEPDTQSPFFDARAPRERVAHGRACVCVVRRR